MILVLAHLEMLCPFAARAFSFLLEQFRNRTQRLVHLLGGSKLECYVRFQDNHVGPLSILRSVLAPHASAEVIFPDASCPCLQIASVYLVSS
jgi:hypothetical protein